jgi:thymidylate synthase
VIGGGSAGDREIGYEIVCSAWKHAAVKKQVVESRTITNTMSTDFAVGLPYNLASYALLTHILAKAANLQPERLIMQLSHVHMYNQHLDAWATQAKRKPLPLPRLNIIGDLTLNLKGMKSYQFVLEGYQSHPTISYEMVVT